MSVSLESLTPLANNFAQTKIISDKQTTIYEKASTALKGDFESQIDFLPIKKIDLNAVSKNLGSYEPKVVKKVKEWANKFQKDGKLELKAGGSSIVLDDTLLMYFNSEFKNIKGNEKYKEFRKAKKEYKIAIKALKSQEKSIEEIESFLKTNDVADRAIRKATYWYHYKV